MIFSAVLRSWVVLLAMASSASSWAGMKPGTTTASGDDEDREGEADEEEALSAAEIRALKREPSVAKAKLKTPSEGLRTGLEQAQAELSSEQAEALVLAILRDDLQQELDRRVAVHRQKLVGVVESWWAKYRVTLRVVETERDAAKGRLDVFLEELGYVR
jgi:type I restriction enzyme M protein